MQRRSNISFTVSLGVFIVAAALAPSAAHAGPMTLVSQNRQVGAMTIVPPCQGSDFESAQAVDFQPFNAAVDAINICDFAQGIACSAHFSDMSSSEFSAWSNAVASALSVPQSVIHAIPQGDFLVTFSVATTIEYKIGGSLTAQGASPVALAQASVKLSDPANNLLFEQVVTPGPNGAENTQPVHAGGVLQAGTYTLRSLASVVIDAYVGAPASGNALASVNFHAAIPGDTNGDNLVNVDDLLIVINAWGLCESKSPCPADIAPLGGDNAVNVDDLLKVINHWG